jgi:membrane protein
MRVHRQHSVAEWWRLVQQAVQGWSEDYAPSMGAALSYYSVFSLAPLLLIVISIAGLAFGAEAARGEVFAQIRGLMGDEPAHAVEELLASLSKPSRGITATLISAGALLIGATTVFGELQDALDRIWRAPMRERSGGLWGLVRSRLLSFGMILGIAFLLIVSLVASAAIAALGRWWSGAFGEWELLLQAVNALVGFGLTTAVFAMIYKLMPRVDVRWHDVWLGAAATALLFTIGRMLIGLYIGKSGIASGFGAAGSVAIIFVWVYYSAQIFLLGAEFTWVYANTFGSMKAVTGGAPQPAPHTRTAPSTPLAHDAGGTAPPEPIAFPEPISPAAPVALAKLGLTTAAALALGYVFRKLLARMLLHRPARRTARPLPSDRAQRRIAGTR